MICPRSGSEMRDGSSNRMQEKLLEWVESQYFHFAGNVETCFIFRLELNPDLVSENRIKTS